MSVRDVFAQHAMAAIVAQGMNGKPELVAANAYRIAQAMVDERERVIKSR